MQTFLPFLGDFKGHILRVAEWHRTTWFENAWCPRAKVDGLTNLKQFLNFCHTPKQKGNIITFPHPNYFTCRHLFLTWCFVCISPRIPLLRCPGDSWLWRWSPCLSSWKLSFHARTKGAVWWKKPWLINWENFEALANSWGTYLPYCRWFRNPLPNHLGFV